ncbi:MAG: C1 family peptidase [Spirochaetales bacterium]|nr:C1 family peptidase [Spirochaetales bacterium]
MKAKRTILIVLLILLPTIMVWAQEYSTGLEEVPDRLQESFAQAQPAGLITEDGAAPGAGMEDTAALPSRVDLSIYLPEIKSQGRIGSCAAWSTIYYARTLLENKERSWGADSNSEIFAPLFTYNQITGGVDQGTYMGDHLEIAVSTGVPTWQTYPDNYNLNARADSRAMTEASRYQAESWKSVSKYNRTTSEWTNDLQDVKTLLAQGLPVIAGFAVYDNLYNYRGGVYRTTTGVFRGGHAMCIVGYDDSARTIKIVNSWGENWGDSGFLTISYDVWPTLANRGCVVLYDKVENTPVIPDPQPPTSVTASKGASYDSVTINWNTVEGSTEYVLYRADNREVELQPLARLRGSEYVDSDLPSGVHYVYALKAVDSSRRESGFSPIAEGWTLEEVIEEEVVVEEEEKKEVVPEAEPGKPGIPGGLDVYVNRRYFVLKWNPVENARSYHIYKWNGRREQWMHYATSRDNALVIRDVYRLYLEGGGYFVISGINNKGEGYASDCLYVNFNTKERDMQNWKRFADSAPLDETIISESRSTEFEGNFYRTDYFDYEYTMQQFRDFYEAEQRAFQEYRKEESDSFQSFQQQEQNTFNSWRTR